MDTDPARGHTSNIILATRVIVCHPIGITPPRYINACLSTRAKSEGYIPHATVDVPSEVYYSRVSATTKVVVHSFSITGFLNRQEHYGVAR